MESFSTFLLNDTLDITSILAETDTSKITLVEGDVLTIRRNAQSMEDGDEENAVLGVEDPIVVKDIPALTFKLSQSKDTDNIKPESLLGEIYPRPNMSIIAKKLGTLPPGDLEITINRTITLDYLELPKNLKTAETTLLPFVSAMHNQLGDVKDLLLSADNNYAEIYPTDDISFSFEANNDPDKKIEYILKSVGRYETDTTYLKGLNKLSGNQEEPIIPKENKLYDNYPNPFNPSTVIKYSLKEEARVTIKIYNTLGEEVKTLIDDIKPEGIYEASFNASHLPSGVYIYRMQTGNYTSVKKMMLIK